MTIVGHDFEPLQPGVQLGSMIHFRRILSHLIDAAKPASIVEIGLEGGIVTDFLVSRAAETGARYVGVDPALRPEVSERFAGRPGVTLIAAKSHDVLNALPCPDMVLIDGDHNHFTVLEELRLLRAAWGRAGEPPLLILMHDTSWPCARRDFYYDPDAVPSGRRRPLADAGGLSILSPELTFHGFGQDENFSIARDLGGDANGVLTALDDFLSETPAFAALHIPAVCGLSVVWPLGRVPAGLGAAIDRLRDGLDLFGELLAQMEYNRLFAYDLFRRERFGPDRIAPAAVPPSRAWPARRAVRLIRAVARSLVPRRLRKIHLLQAPARCIASASSGRPDRTDDPSVGVGARAHRSGTGRGAPSRVHGSL